MPLLTLYLAALVLGGTLLALSIFGGGDGDLDLDADADLDADVDLDADADLDADGDADTPGGLSAGDALAWLPLSSLRFWTFFLGFGGLTGTLLALVGEPAWLSAPAAGLVGWLAGLSAVRVLRRLQREKVSSSVEETDFIGASGTVLLPVARGQLGQVRVRVKGRDLDVPAETQDDHPLLVEAPVLVCEVRDGVALVSRLDEVA